MAGEGKFNRWSDSQEVLAQENTEAAESRIQMIDLSKNWTTSGLFVKTTFSSHFNWK